MKARIFSILVILVITIQAVGFAGVTVAQAKAPELFVAQEKALLVPLAGNLAGVAALVHPDQHINNVLTVISTDDVDDGSCNVSHCSLREAIKYANAGDQIWIYSPLAGQTITLSSPVTINKNLTFVGPVGSTINIKYPGGTVFTISAGVTVSMQRLTFTGSQRGINNQGTLSADTVVFTNNAITGWSQTTTGAGISNTGNATLTNCVFQSNSSGYVGGAVYSNGGSVTISNSRFVSNSAFAGGAIGSEPSSNAQITVNNSLLLNNSAVGTGGQGGGMFLPGTSSITNTTITGSTGSGIISGGTLTLQNVTITYSSTDGLDNGATLNFTNTLIGYNAGDDCYNTGTIGTNDHNLTEDGTCGAAISGDPQVANLAANGATIETHALKFNSPAVDAGTSTGCPAADPRGAGRPSDGNGDGIPACDIGAYEVGTLGVNSTSATNDGVCDTNCTLKDAISQARDWDVILFYPALYGATLSIDSLDINKSVAIYGPIGNPVTLQGSDTANIFNITGSTNMVILRDMKVSHGKPGINNSANLTLNHVTVGSNSSPDNGAGISNTGNLTVLSSLIESNSATNFGGGIYTNGGSVTLKESTVKNNSAQNGGGIYETNSALIGIEQSLFVGNSASVLGGGLFLNDPATIKNTTIDGGAKGGIINYGSLTLNNVTITGSSTYGLMNAGVLYYSNSILAYNGWGDYFDGGIGAILSSDTNWVMDGSGNPTYTGDPLLDTLKDNGGATLTRALQASSLAIDQGNDATCETIDQRGVQRPKDGNDDGLAYCDIGAFELAFDIDYGDAPSPFPTIKADNGARHFLRSGFYLGTGVDIDADGLPSLNADGDDTNNTDDEDGVTFLSPLRTNDTAEIQVNLSGNGYLYAWVDLNQDGDWDDRGENVISGAYKATGTHTFTFLIPSTASFGSTYARFRFSSYPRLSYQGLAMDGEVEDYKINIQRGRPVAVPDKVALDENTNVLIDVIANDSEPHGTFSLQAAATPLHGTVALESGKVRYSPGSDYSGADTFTYTIVNDIGLSQSAQVKIFIRNINTAPKDIQLTNPVLLEATCTADGMCTLPSGKPIGSLRVLDPDPGDTHLFSFGNPADFRISGTNLFTNQPITFAGNTQTATRTLNVKVVDAGGLSFSKEFTLYILGDKVSGGPTKIDLSNNTVTENLSAGTLIGILTTTQINPPAAQNEFAYSKVSGEGSGDNDKINIVGNQIFTAQSLNYEAKDLLRVRIRSQYTGGLRPKDEIFTIKVLNDPNEPPEPPPFCSGEDITLIENGDATVRITNVTASNVSVKGCSIHGNMALTVKGWSGNGISFDGKVSERNQLTAGAGNIAEFIMELAGLPLKVSSASLTIYDGSYHLSLGKAAFCLPNDWGGLCAPTSITGVSMMIDESGVRTGGSFKIGLPDIKLNPSLSLSGLSGALVPVLGGYELQMGAVFNMPFFKNGTKGSCGIVVSVTIGLSDKGELVMEIETKASELRELSLGMACKDGAGIPIANTGLILTSVNGTVTLRSSSSNVKISATVATKAKLPVFKVPLMEGYGSATVQWSPKFQIDLVASITVLKFLDAGGASATITENSVTVLGRWKGGIVAGIMEMKMWTDWATSVHLTSRGNVDVGFKKGNILSKCACLPVPTDVCYKWGFIPYPCGWEEQCGCLDVPPFNLYITVGTELGEFTNGAWGLKGWVDLPVVGDVGIFVDTQPSLTVGGVAQYQLVSGPKIMAALQEWRTNNALGLVSGPSQFNPDKEIVVKSGTSVSVRAPVNLKDAKDQSVTPVELDTQKNTLFSVSAFEPLGLSLQAPDGTLITPANYASIPGYTIDYNEEFYYQSNTGEDAETGNQPMVRLVLAATNPEWERVNISLDGQVLFEGAGLEDAAPSIYLPINAATYTLSVSPTAGGSTVEIPFTADLLGTYTILVSGAGSPPSVTILNDELDSPTAQGKARVRFVHTAAFTHPVDIYVDGNLLLNDANGFTVSNYLELDADSVAVEIKDATNNQLIAPSQEIELVSGGVYSLFDAAFASGDYPLAWSQFLDKAYLERYLMQYKVWNAPNGNWLVTMDGNLDTSLPMLAVLGFANASSVEDVHVTSTVPLHPVVSYRVNSDYLPTTVQIFANPDDYGIKTEPVFQGVEVARFDLTNEPDVRGNLLTFSPDLSSLETGTYTLWMRVDNGVNPPVSTYALNSGGGVAQLFINQSTTFPAAWNPEIQSDILRETTSLELTWEGLNHPDVDGYSLFVNTQPNNPVLYTSDLAAVRASDENGNPTGLRMANTTVSNLEPGKTYYYSVEAVDYESGKKVRSSEGRITVPTGDFALYTDSQEFFNVVPGQVISFPVYLLINEPLFYPYVGLSIDSTFTPPGTRIWFDSPMQADMALQDHLSYVWVNVELGESLPKDMYSVTINGVNGNMTRGLTVRFLQGFPQADLQIEGSYTLSGAGEATFTYVATNLGPQTADGAAISLPFPDSLQDATWTCLGSGGAVCGNSHGVGDIYDVVDNLAPGSSVTYTAVAKFNIYSTFYFEVTGDIQWWSYGDDYLENNTSTVKYYMVLLPIIRR